MDEAEKRIQKAIEVIKKDPRGTFVEGDKEGDGDVVEVEITLIPKMSESQKEYWRSKRKRDEGSA